MTTPRYEVTPRFRLEIASAQTDAVKKGGASGTLLTFLEKHDGLPTKELTAKLNILSVELLNETSDSAFADLLKAYGWSTDHHEYRNKDDPDQAIDVDVGNLIADLKKLTMKRTTKQSTLRASQVGVRNTIKSFAPDLLMIYTLEEMFHTQKTLTPYSTFFDGVCMLADISGFTRLSGKFCERGKDGIDQLQQVVNGYLGQLVKIVYAYGGDVMKFAGDALVCVFLPSRYAGGGRILTMPDVCSNAIQCATEVAEQYTDSLTVHVAISCGSICFAMLGGTNHPNKYTTSPSMNVSCLMSLLYHILPYHFHRFWRSMGMFDFR